MPLHQCQSDLYHPSFPQKKYRYTALVMVRPNINDPISITRLCLIVTECSGWWQQMPNTKWLFFTYMHRTWQSYCPEDGMSTLKACIEWYCLVDHCCAMSNWSPCCAGVLLLAYLNLTSSSAKVFVQWFVCNAACLSMSRRDWFSS